MLLTNNFNFEDAEEKNDADENMDEMPPVTDTDESEEDENEPV
jgi:hypothetical protein